MTKKRIISLTMASMILFAGISSNHKVLATTTPKLINSQIKCSSVIWKQEYNIKKNKLIKVDLNNDKKLEDIQVGMDTPNGTKVNVYFKDKGYNLMNYCSIGKDSSLFDDYGDLNKNNYIQVNFIDLDNDKRPEVLVAAGDNLVELQVSVLKYTGNNNKPYKEIGFIEGQKNMIVTKAKTIEAPYGSQGLFALYKLNKGKFVETNK